LSEEWKHASWVSTLGKWAWVISIISGIINIIVGLTGAIAFSGTSLLILGNYIWLIISGIIVILISFFIIKPKFSDKCADQNWDFLFNWVIPLGNIRFPWMLFWGIIVDIFGYWWGGLPILIPALVLIFAGPKPYEWKTE